MRQVRLNETRGMQNFKFEDLMNRIEDGEWELYKPRPEEDRSPKQAFDHLADG
jgi:hypothetical protein